jgi:hypothetical protein
MVIRPASFHHVISRIISPRLLVPASLSLLLAACGGSDSTPSSGTPTLTGTAAVGAPINGATISIKCANGTSASTTTNANGAYGIVISTNAFPCAIKASGGTANGTSAPALHSFVNTAGQANITPLTDLALALQVNATAGQTLTAWFSAPDLTQLNIIGTGLATALNTLRTAMTTAGYIIPAAWTVGSTAPFTTSFTPNPSAADGFDRLLEALATAIENSITYADYNALLTAFATTPSGTLPTAPEDTSLPNPTGTGAALGSGDGVTGTHNGIAYTYTDISIDSSNSNFPSLIIAKGINNNDYWRISPGVANQAPGLYDCNTSTDAAPWLWIGLGVNGTGATSTLSSGACRIEIISNDSSLIEGRFVATLPALGAIAGGNVLDGYFRFHKPVGNDPETQATTIHTSLAKNYNLTFAGNCGSACPFINNQTYSASVSGNNLVINSKTLTNPVNNKVGGSFNLNEAIWTDGNIRYALSNNQTGVFNEINVNDASQLVGGQPKFLGQFTEADDTGSGNQSGPIGFATVTSFTNSSSLIETATAVIGIHDVAIYQAPSIDEIGVGKLVVSYNNDNLSFTLKSNSGTILTTVTVPISDTSCGDGVCVNVFDQFTTPIGGRRISIRDYYVDPVKKAILVGFLPNGYIHGTADGGYGFRNNVLTFGTNTPAVFSTLAGSYSGPHEANTCLPNPISVTINSNGTLHLLGKTSLSCAAQDHTVTWDGQDDYIVPTESGAQLVMDSTKIGGSQTGGGISLNITNGDTANTFSTLYSNFSGVNGHITLPNPVKE